MAGLIEIEGMEFYSYHGYFPSEKKIGSLFEVAVSIETDCETAGQTDQLADALNYQEVYTTIQKEMKQPSDLLEHVCWRIKNRLLSRFPSIEAVTVKLSKINPPMGGKIRKVSVRLSGTRENR